MSPGEVRQDCRRAERTKRDHTPLTDRDRNGSRRKRLKLQLIFNPYENSEQTAQIMSQSIYKARQGKIRPVAQISPSGSFVPLVNLVGVATPNPPLTGAERRYCDAAVSENFIQFTTARRLHFCNFSGLSYANLHFCHIYGLTSVFSVY